jgi:hypothetical protein
MEHPLEKEVVRNRGKASGEANVRFEIQFFQFA